VVDAAHVEISGLISAKSTGKKIPEKWFGGDVEHFLIFGIQLCEHVHHHEVLQTMPFKRSATGALDMKPQSGEGIEIPKWTMIVTQRAVELRFVQVQPLECGRRKANLIFYPAYYVAHLKAIVMMVSLPCSGIVAESSRSLAVGVGRCLGTPEDGTSRWRYKRSIRQIDRHGGANPRSFWPAIPAMRELC
jgi:hypothetical protein